MEQHKSLTNLHSLTSPSQMLHQQPTVHVKSTERTTASPPHSTQGAKRKNSLHPQSFQKKTSVNSQSIERKTTPNALSTEQKMSVKRKTTPYAPSTEQNMSSTKRYTTPSATSSEETPRRTSARSTRQTRVAEFVRCDDEWSTESDDSDWMPGRAVSDESSEDSMSY